MIDLTGYKLTFDDEFNARSISLTGAGTTWRDTRAQWLGDAFSDVGFGTSSFVDPGSGYDPFSVSQGVLSITAVPDRTPFGVPGAWESGLITTQGHFSQIYGYFEIRADFSNLPGACPVVSVAREIARSRLMQDPTEKPFERAAAEQHCNVDGISLTHADVRDRRAQRHQHGRRFRAGQRHDDPALPAPEFHGHDPYY